MFKRGDRVRCIDGIHAEETGGVRSADGTILEVSESHEDFKTFKVRLDDGTITYVDDLDMVKIN